MEILQIKTPDQAGMTDARPLLPRVPVGLWAQLEVARDVIHRQIQKACDER